MAKQKTATHYRNYIDGQWCDSAETSEVINPATEHVVGSVALAGQAEVDQAVAAARACVNAGLLTKPRPVERARLLLRIADELTQLIPHAVPILVAENGKTTDEARVEFEVAIRYFEYYAGIADKIEGKSIPLGEDYIDFTYYEPMGVSAQIVPWNYPVDICARSLAPALSAGNAVVIKSPELTPLAITYIALACQRAGAPQGSVNLICGYGNIAGAALVAHHDIDQVVFTGSVATGQTVLRSAATRAVPCVMELGGKSAAVVFADADLDALMTSVDWGIFFNAGQVCSAMSRLLVHQDIHGEVVARVKQLAQAQVIGAGVELNTSLTPVASAKQQAAVLKLCEQAQQQGAELVIGGDKPQRAGYFINPTVFDNVSGDNALFTNEAFGPVLAITPFSTEQQAYDLANATDYGLVAGVFTKDLNIALRASRQLNAGQVFVNEWFAGGVETPFGGKKRSGYGREKGQEALYSYVNTKNVCIRVKN